MANIEFIQGQESHSSNWGKFYVKGLENYQVKEDFEENIQEKHYSYQGYVCLNIPENTLFSIFIQEGDKKGTDVFEFYICSSTDGQIGEVKSNYTGCWVTGNFKIIAEAKTKTKAPRLMSWWTSSNQTLEEASHFAYYIQKRGIKTPPPIK